MTKIFQITTGGKYTAADIAEAINNHHFGEHDCGVIEVPASGKLVNAARAMVKRWDTLLWKDVPATAEYLNKLRNELSKFQ